MRRPVLRLAIAAAVLGATSPGCTRRSPPLSLLIISLDTTRADHLSAYGYHRPTSPRIDALARQAVLFRNAFAPETNTNPCHASLFTGLYPHVHGNLDNGYRLSVGWPTLPQILSDSGFRTGGFVSGYSMASSVTGFERGFEVYDDELPSQHRRDGELTVDRALGWLQTVTPEERVFLFVHLFDAHGPYAAPSAYREMFRSTSPGPRLREVPRYQLQVDEDGQSIRHANPYVDRYDASIRYMDELVGRLLDAVDLERTVVVLLADHGETLAERHWGLAHGGQLFDEQIRIPLIVHIPGVEASRVEQLVEMVDLLPTVLEALDVRPPPALTVNGESLTSLLSGGESADRVVLSAARAASPRHADRGPTRCARSGAAGSRRQP